jgi:hypothetical protein
VSVYPCGHREFKGRAGQSRKKRLAVPLALRIYGVVMSRPRKLLPKDFERPFSADPQEAKRRRAEALQSAFMRVPQVGVEAARDLLDLGFTQFYQLAGRAPDALFADLRKRRPDTPPERLAQLRLAVYVAETPVPDRALLHAGAWGS